MNAGRSGGALDRFRRWFWPAPLLLALLLVALLVAIWLVAFKALLTAEPVAEESADPH